jgi:hypothetical protein
VLPSGSRNQNIGGTGPPIGVDVDAKPLELGIGFVDVVGGEADTGLDPGRVALPRRRQGDAGGSARRVDLDPAVALAERDVGALLEAERLVELDRSVLIGTRDHHQADLADVGCCLAHVGLSLVAVVHQV